MAANAVNNVTSPQFLPIQRQPANNNNRANNASNLTSFEQIAALNSQLESLNQIASGDAQSDPFSLGSADLLTLSPQALSILNGINGLTPDGTLNATSGITSSLATAQQQQISGVLTNFLNASFTQDTFTQLQNALIASGISPQQITVQQLLLSFNPALTLLFAQSTQVADQNIRRNAA